MMRRSRREIDLVPNRLSIIVATRGNRPSIRQALKSIRPLTDAFDVEIIVLCPQRSSLVAEAARASGATFVIEPDSSIYEAWNKGIDRSSGQVVGFLNDDDRYLPGAVGVARKALAGVDIAVGAARVVGDGAVLHEIRPFSLRDRRFVLGVPSAINRAFIRRELFAEARIGPFDPDLRIVGDKEWIARLVLRGDCSEEVVDALAYEYSQHGESLTYHGQLPSQAHTEERLAVFSALARSSKRRLSPYVWQGGALVMSIVREIRAASGRRAVAQVALRLRPGDLLLMMLWFVVDGWRFRFLRRRAIRAPDDRTGSHQ